MDNSSLVYVVINEGEVVFASYDKEQAENFAYNQSQNALQTVLSEEWKIDDPTEKDIDEASFQSGFDNGIWEVFPFDISTGQEDDEVDIGGEIIEYNDIITKLAESEE